MQVVHPILYRVRKVMLALSVLAWLGAFSVSHIPADVMHEIKTPSDTTLHMSGFAILAGLFLLALAAFNVRTMRRSIIVLAVMALYAALDERTQPLVNRVCDVRDWYADMAGSIIVVIVLGLLLHIFARRRANRVRRLPIET